MSVFLKDQQEYFKFRYAVYIVFSFIALMWFVKALELAGGTNFSQLGILPRTPKGIIGILTAPLIHGDVLHLLSNSLPLIVLGILMFYFYHRIAIKLFLWIYLTTGFCIWLLARNAYHIGASGVVYGMASFLFFSGIFRKSHQLMTVSGVIIILYGGMLYGMFPDFVETNVSWESHLLGGVSGIFLAFFFRKTNIDIGDENKEPDEHADDPENHDFFSAPDTSGDIETFYTYKPSKKTKSEE